MCNDNTQVVVVEDICDTCVSRTSYVQSGRSIQECHHIYY